MFLNNSDFFKGPDNVKGFVIRKREKETESSSDSTAVNLWLSQNCVYMPGQHDRSSKI